MRELSHRACSSLRVKDGQKVRAYIATEGDQFKYFRLDRNSRNESLCAQLAREASLGSSARVRVLQDDDGGYILIARVDSILQPMKKPHRVAVRANKFITDNRPPRLPHSVLLASLAAAAGTSMAAYLGYRHRYREKPVEYDDNPSIQHAFATTHSPVQNFTEFELALHSLSPERQVAVGGDLSYG